MNRGYLALGLGLVVVAVFALYVVTATHDEVPASPSRSQHVPETPEADPGRPSQPPALPLDRGAELAAANGSGSATDYMVGDVRVRDHRTGDHTPIDVPPAVHAPGGRKISSTVTYDLSQQLRPLVTACAASAPKDARGAKPRADGQLTIAIKNHQLTVMTATYQVRDVTGDSADAVKTCLEQKSVGVSSGGGDEADVENYAIALSLRLP